jgi:hypothetical protein
MDMGDPDFVCFTLLILFVTSAASGRQGVWRKGYVNENDRIQTE